MVVFLRQPSCPSLNLLDTGLQGLGSYADVVLDIFSGLRLTVQSPALKLQAAAVQVVIHYRLEIYFRIHQLHVWVVARLRVVTRALEITCVGRLLMGHRIAFAGVSPQLWPFALLRRQRDRLV